MLNFILKKEGLNKNYKNNYQRLRPKTKKKKEEEAIARALADNTNKLKNTSQLYREKKQLGLEVSITKWKGCLG